MSSLVECIGLSKSYTAQKMAVSSLNIKIEKGHIIGLLGPNGSGKTTLIKMINGLLTPTEGEILINGYAPGVESKKKVSYLPEKTYLSAQKTVQSLLDFFEEFYDDFDKERAYKMIESLKINPEDALKTMSKGTKEKIQLILVMSRNADLYVLDEPIAGVDPAARDYIIKTIISNFNPEASLIISTHLITDIENILDEVILIKDGMMVEHASVEELREREGKSVDSYFREVFAC